MTHSYSLVTSKQYYEYIDEKRKKNLSYLIILFTIFIFIFSCIDIIFSFSTTSYPCQTMKNISIIPITFELWLKINGIFGIIYYGLFVTFMIINHITTENYNLINNTNVYIKRITFSTGDICMIIFNVVFMTCNIGSIIIGGIMFVNYQNVCSILLFNIYIWVHLTVTFIGCFFIIYFLYKYFKHENTTMSFSNYHN